MNVKGTQFGVNLLPRGDDDPSAMVQLISEDDGNWFEHGGTFSSHWIDDLIVVLQAAKYNLNLKAQRSVDGFGWIFKK